MSTQPKCQKCGEVGKCYHDGDINKSGTRYVDQYRFQCTNPNCMYTEETHVDGGDAGGTEWFTSCPYCGYNKENDS